MWRKEHDVVRPLGHASRFPRQTSAHEPAAGTDGGAARPPPAYVWSRHAALKSTGLDLLLRAQYENGSTGDLVLLQGARLGIVAYSNHARARKSSPKAEPSRRRLARVRLGSGVDSQLTDLSCRLEHFAKRLNRAGIPANRSL